MEHNCDKNKCKGPKMSGVFFVCAKCKSKSFVDCVLGEEEVSNLLISIEMATILNGRLIFNSAKSTVSKQTFDSIFHDQSLIKFICKGCDVDLQNQAVQMNENEQLKEEVEAQKTLIQSLKNELKERDDIIKNLTDSDENPEKISESGHGLQHTNIEEIQNVLLSKVKVMLSNEVEQISAKITKECKKVEIFCTNKIIEVESKQNVKKPNPFKQQNDQNTSLNTHNQPKNIVFSDAILPGNINQNNVNHEYVMHVSKFDIDKKVECIIDHVIQNTSINDTSDFEVEKLGNENADFASFKISTRTSEMYEEIKGIWGPHYYARDFVMKRNGHGNITMMNKSDKRSMRKFVRETPKVSFKHNQFKFRNEKNQHSKIDYNMHTPKRVRMRESYDTPNRYSRKYEQRSEPKKTPQPTTQYVYLPTYQQPMINPTQPTFFVPPPGQQHIIQPMQQMFQPIQNQNQQQQQQMQQTQAI